MLSWKKDSYHVLSGKEKADGMCYHGRKSYHVLPRKKRHRACAITEKRLTACVIMEKSQLACAITEKKDR